MAMHKNNAFTLIELLVVIAIIGILSAIVLAALGSARDNAKEASILSSLNSARTQAELYHLSNNSYSGLCDDEKIQEIVSSASSTGAGAVCWEATNAGGTYVEGSSSNLAMVDYGVGAKLDDTYYVSSPFGSGALGGLEGTMDWEAAKAACGNTGGRLPSPSEIRAIHGIDNGDLISIGGYLWSGLERSSTHAYRTYPAGGHVNTLNKTDVESAHCVQ